MRRIAMLALASTALLVGLGEVASAQQLRRAEKLLGANENPPVVTDGTGRFRAELFDDRIEYRLRYDLGADASEVTQAHLHIANPGNNGGITVFLCTNLDNAPDGLTVPECPQSGEITGEIVADDVQVVTEGDPPVTVLEAGDLDGLVLLLKQGAVYANVHSGDHPTGEIRGQLSSRPR